MLKIQKKTHEQYHKFTATTCARIDNQIYWQIDAVCIFDI